MRVFLSFGLLYPLLQTCVASPPSSALKHGTIGMGITMYHPPCAYACSDTLSGLYLNCTTFDDMAGMSMDGMVMKVKKRMDMSGKAAGTTSSECRATDNVWLQTFAYCLKANCAVDNVKESDIEAVWQVLAAGGQTPPPYRNSIPSSAPTEELDSDAMWLNTTALVNHNAYWNDRQTLIEFEFQEDTHVLLSTITLVGTVMIVLLIGAFHRLNVSKSGPSLPNWIPRYITLPALISSRHQVPLPYNIGYAPSRATSIFIFFFVSVQIIFCSVPYKSTLPGASNTWFSTEKREISAYVANRTGVLSFANLALAILFAIRNNPLLWVTGISQTTSLIFHRWAARVSAVQAIVHSIIYTYTYFWSGGYASYAAEAAKAYYWWGIIATLALFLGTALSVLPLRLRFYETFVIVHIAMAILALVGCWYHIYLRFEHNWGYEVWIYIAIAFWSWDRIVRFSRLVYYNWIGVSTKATAELLPGDELIKLTIFPGRSWSYGAGQHTYLSFPTLGYRPWESHPFSIVGWGSSSSLMASNSAPSIDGTSSDGEKKDVNVTATPVSTPSSTPDAKSIVFLIRPYNGITKKLHQHLFSKTRGPQSIRVWTEGPHGHTAQLKNFDHVLLVGGGIGITALLPYAQAFAWARTAKQTMTLAYTAREQQLLSTTQQMLPDGVEGLEFQLRVTESENMRMNLGAVVRREAAKVGQGRLAIVVCGPPGLADEVRQQAVRVVQDGKSVELFEESFCW